ncbi:MAG: hypothetical protein GWM98_16410, partial [Nitrospinaceae bacterium]|nr:hypothetical protein [Nitrospinaceae bacterium]
FMNERIQTNLARLKQRYPGWRLGETHCHSTFSDGQSEIPDILLRAARLGLDFVILTEHLIPGKYSLQSCLKSIEVRARCVRQWDVPGIPPVQVYPAFEVSTREGHLILVFPQDYLHPGRCRELERPFSVFDREMWSMEKTAALVRPFGGISIIAHPGRERSYPFGVPIPFAKQHLTGLVDAVEDISTGHGYQESYSTELDMAAIGSSDDHFNVLIGTSVTGYDGARHADFIDAVRARETRAFKVESSLDDVLTAARLVL